MKEVGTSGTPLRCEVLLLNNSYSGGYAVSDEVIISKPGVAEKGGLNVRFEISAPGGHSSVPPAHTVSFDISYTSQITAEDVRVILQSIGMLAAVIKQLEDNPHKPHLNRSGIYYSLLQCQAEHDPSLPANFRSLIVRSRRSEKALHTLEDHLLRTDRLFPALAGTTQAADVIRGGVKTNALPERAQVIVNHRIDIHSSVAALQQRIISVVKPVAERFGLELDAFGLVKEDPKEAANGVLRITDAFGTGLEPAPRTPLGDSGPFRFLSGTIVGVLGGSGRTGYDKKVVVAPAMSTGNTGMHHVPFLCLCCTMLTACASRC